ncbi:restriction endonuclease subunit S [Geoglobus acetivorans]|uniref:Restriction endonuclease subunit S n=1 Tax=Geoglobus acetivorans TaxID=565033 RepID=A0ABZ3H058_GEOAI|nr:restriction endonuclease subunit S [Geoglobus acetivorans]
MAEDVRVPEGWKKASLGEIADINMGQSPPSNVINEIGIGTPFLQGNAEFTNKYPAPRKWVIKPSKLSKKGDILISVRAPVGEVNKADRVYCIGRGLAAISFKSVDEEFGWFGLIYWKHLLEDLSQGSTFEAISKDDLRNLLLLVPTSLQEQRKIAEILSTVDSAIEKTDRIIEKYKRIKQGLMQELLTRGIDENGQIRSEETHRFRDSPLGRIPEEWEVVELGEVFDFYAGGDIDKLNFSPDKTNIFKYPIFSNTLENKGLYGYSDTYTYPENSITITARGALGVAIPRFEKFNAIIRLLVLVPKYEVDVRFISEYINGFVKFYVEETGIPQLTVPKASRHLIPLPPLPEQQRIASILSQIDKAIEKEQAYKEKLERIKRGLMEDLLTGKVRVNHLIEEVGQNGN